MQRQRAHRGIRPRLAIGALVAAVGLLLIAVPAVQGAPAPSRASRAACAGPHWVATWAAAPQSSSVGRADDVDLGLADGPERTFNAQSLRMIVTPHVGGSAIRVHLSNRYGPDQLVFDAVTLGTRAAQGNLLPGTVHALAFGGSPSVRINPGDEAISDPLFLRVQPFTDLAVSFDVAGRAVLDYHQWAQQTNYVAPRSSGDHADDESGAAFSEEITSSYAVSAVDVLTSASLGAVVAIGDSITDGIGSSPNTNQRWTDQLARRLLAASARSTVVNAGIAGNHVTTDGLTSRFAIGPSAQQRFTRDVLGTAGVTDAFVFEGINDIFMSEPNTNIADKVIDGYRMLIAKAHAVGVRFTTSTITPAAMTGPKERARQAVNTWIRTSGAPDGVVDFDAVVRDPRAPSMVRPGFDAHLAHLTDRGYRALANAVDLTMFQGTGCGA